MSVARKSTSSSRGIFHLYQRTTYPQYFFLPARSFSTPPSTTSKSKDTSGVHTIPPPSVKHKVELRPGPKKPALSPSSSHTPKVKQLPSTNPSPPLQSTPIAANPSDSIVETVKEDLKHAYIHGVLARPPPNAGKLAILWHQAKELFVRWIGSHCIGANICLLVEILLQRFEVGHHASQAGQRDPSAGEGRR